MATSEAAIRVRGVFHRFGEAGEQRFVRALADTSLDIAAGELMCLIGPSGCGKSTLLNIMGGLMAPSAGTVEVRGQPVRGPLPRDIAFVFQENSLFPWNTVIENVELGMTFQGVSKSARAARAAEALAAVGLKEFALHYPAQLSGGMRQRAEPEDADLADGRAVRRPRRADPDDPGRGSFGAARAEPQDHRVRHPQLGRGRVSRRSRGGVFGTTRQHQAGDRGR